MEGTFKNSGIWIMEIGSGFSLFSPFFYFLAFLYFPLSINYLMIDIVNIIYFEIFCYLSTDKLLLCSTLIVAKL